MCRLVIILFLFSRVRLQNTFLINIFSSAIKNSSFLFLEMFLSPCGHEKKTQKYFVKLLMGSDVEIWFRSRIEKHERHERRRPHKKASTLVERITFYASALSSKINNIRNANLCIHNNINFRLWTSQLCSSFKWLSEWGLHPNFPQLTWCLPFQFLTLSSSSSSCLFSAAPMTSTEI